MEISTMVKKWMPNLEILEPIEWRDKLTKELEYFLRIMTDSVK
jgi:hypothetical protein